MNLEFDRGTDSRDPISVQSAIERGRSVVVVPVYTIMASVAGFAIVSAAITGSRVLGFVLLVVGFVAGWLWWSYAVPRWRHWALRRGADPDELQKAAERAKLLWPRGHFLEKTEFPFKS
jgi:hypothetical protein